MTAFEDPEHDLAPSDARHVIDERDAEVIDVRLERERVAGHIPGSRHLDMDQLANEADTISRDRPVIFYCRKGVRSALAAHGFRASGWDAYNLKGGLLAWADASEPIEPPGGHVAEH